MSRILPAVIHHFLHIETYSYCTTKLNRQIHSQGPTMEFLNVEGTYVGTARSNVKTLSDIEVEMDDCVSYHDSELCL